MPPSVYAYRHPARLFVAVAFLLVGFALRVDHLTTRPGGLHNDETVYLYRAWRFAQGYGMPLYFYDAPEPFDALARSVWLRAAGITPFASQVFSIYLALVALAGVTLAARALFPSHPYRHEIALMALLTLATIPAYVIISRSIYRAAWVAPMTILALTSSVLALRRQQMWRYALAGLLTALATMFYLSSIIFPVAAGISALAAWSVYRVPLPRWRQATAYAAAFGLAMLPWFFLFITIPNWLTTRLEVLPGVNPVAQPGDVLAGYARYAASVVQPTPAGLRDIQYTVGTMGYLNPLLAGAAALGSALSLWRWRRAFWLYPLLLLVVMALPAILSGEPDHALRVIGTYAPLSLLAGLGAASIFVFIRRRWLIYLLIVGLGLGSAAHTAQQIYQHFTAHPSLTTPYGHSGMNALYHLGFAALNQIIAAQTTPVYVPMNIIGHPNSTVILRPAHYPQVRGYTGEPLPTGKVIFPLRAGYDYPPIDVVQQYVLLLPDEGTLVILPRLPLDTARALQNRIETNGTPLLHPTAGWQLGYTLPLAGSAFAALDTPATPVNAVFDDTLELVALHVPRAAQPGDVLDVTLFWRLKRPTWQDYWVVIQAFDAAGISRGSTQEWLYNWLYPTPMWQPGQIIPQFVQVRLFEDAPGGAYRFSLGVFVKPRNTFVSAQDFTGTLQANARVLAGRFVVPPLPPAEPLPPDALPLDITAAALRLTHTAFAPRLDQVRPGTTLDVTLFWQTNQPIPTDYTLFLHVQDEQGHLVSQWDGQPFGGLYPTGHWGVAEDVTTRHTLTIPAPITGALKLYVGLYDPVTLVRAPMMQAGAAVPDDRAIITQFNLAPGTP